MEAWLCAGLACTHCKRGDNCCLQAEDVLAATVAWLQSLPANLLEQEADGSSPPQEKGRPAQLRDDSHSPINKLSLILTGKLKSMSAGICNIVCWQIRLGCPL